MSSISARNSWLFLPGTDTGIAGNRGSGPPAQKLQPVRRGFHATRIRAAHGLCSASWPDCCANRSESERTLTSRTLRLFAKTPKDFKVWSQNLGHDDVLTTFYSYGQVDSRRQAEIIRDLAKPRPRRELDQPVEQQSFFWPYCSLFTAVYCRLSRSFFLAPSSSDMA
jgi:hypothetical protein